MQKVGSFKPTNPLQSKDYIYFLWLEIMAMEEELRTMKRLINEWKKMMEEQSPNQAGIEVSLLFWSQWGGQDAYCLDVTFIS